MALPNSGATTSARSVDRDYVSGVQPIDPVAPTFSTTEPIAGHGAT